MLAAELLDDGGVGVLDQLQELGGGAVRGRGAAELPLDRAGGAVDPQHLRRSRATRPRSPPSGSSCTPLMWA